jgi:hypothetical protein
MACLALLPYAVPFACLSVQNNLCSGKSIPTFKKFGKNFDYLTSTYKHYFSTGKTSCR